MTFIQRSESRGFGEKIPWTVCQSRDPIPLKDSEQLLLPMSSQIETENSRNVKEQTFEGYARERGDAIVLRSWSS